MVSSRGGATPKALPGETAADQHRASPEPADSYPAAANTSSIRPAAGAASGPHAGLSTEGWLPIDRPRY
jgi:hypothetical protein